MNKLFTFSRETALGRFLIPLGLALIIFSFFAFRSVNHSKDFVKTEAVVSKVVLYEEEYTDADDVHYEATYTVFVKYTVDQTEYEEEYGVFSGYKEGQKVTISYNPNNPKEITQPNSIVLPIVLLSAGIVSLVIGIFSIVKAVKKQKALKLQEEGWKNGN